jgi:hypothetical protein
MRQSRSNKNRQTAVSIKDKINNTVGFEFELLVLAMLTGLDLELTTGQIVRNIRRLLIQLKLSRKKVIPRVRLAISFLLSNELIVHKDHGYVPSIDGRSLGKKILTILQKNLSTH